MFFFKKHYTLIYNALFCVTSYPTPAGINYFWNFGFLSGCALVSQILTGLFLSFWYLPSFDLAFSSVDFIVREVTLGWFIRFLHANGASFFFLVIYIHIGRNIYFGSYTYPRDFVWYSGVIIFILLILTAFLGYVLPWGQMSYWAATVISSLVSVVPFVGTKLLLYLWGGISIGQPTLTRIYGLHYLLPFIILGFILGHTVFLHEFGSNNIIGSNLNKDIIPFHPYFTFKDLLGFIFFFFALFFFVFFSPDHFGHSDNYIGADPFVTPTHIVPEWYFLPFYGILRSVPSKSGGVLLLVLALLVIFFLPLLSQPLFSCGSLRPYFKPLYFLIVVNWFVLGWSGGKPVEDPYFSVCKFSTFFFFFSLLVLNQIIILFENYLFCKYYFEKPI